MTGRRAPTRAVAVIPVRSGQLPLGAAEVAVEAPSSCWLIGDGCGDVLAELDGLIDTAVVVEAPGFDPTGWAAALGSRLPEGEHVLLPHSPDGRDLAPHLAATLARPLVSAATALGDERALVARHGGLTMETLALSEPIVATFQVGVRDVPLPVPGRALAVERLRYDDVVAGAAAGSGVVAPGGLGRVQLLEQLPPDPATMDLAEAPRIVAGGAGLGDRDQVEPLHEVAARLGASVGATRVVTDWGWISADRQIGTTGVTVDPDLYLAVGISGAIQHTAGLGAPRHVIAVNTDPSCPMMELADLPIVCDGPAFVAELLRALDGLSRTSATR